ncbi:hypothetical protein KM043_016092 [Ampulex compressa]|nr:hypothetical protein KM043_016092 [Ampulex compressa]
MRIDLNQWKYLVDLDIGDPDRSTPESVELIIRVDYYESLLQQGLRVGGLPRTLHLGGGSSMPLRLRVLRCSGKFRYLLDMDSETYQLLTVTYSTTCAPYMANRVLRQLAEDEGDDFLAAREMIKHHFYVNELLL